MLPPLLPLMRYALGATLRRRVARVRHGGAMRAARAIRDARQLLPRRVQMRVY